MRRLIAVVLAALALQSSPAFAMYARLIHCSQERSFSGQVIWVGLYEVAGHGTFERTFRSWCPASLQVQ